MKGVVTVIVVSIALAVSFEAGAGERRYDGLPLAEWEHRIGELDPAGAHSAAAVPALTEIVADRDVSWVTRRRAAITLARIGRPAASAVPVLIRLLDEQGPDAAATRAWAGRALSLFGPLAAPAAPHFARRALDESLPIAERQMCIAALSGIGGAHEDVVPALVELLQYRPAPGAAVSSGEGAALRQLAAEALALMGREGVVALPILVRMTRNPSETEMVRREAIRALGALRGEAEPAIHPLLEALVLDRDEAVRDAAAEALASVGPAASPVLEQYLRHADAGVRWRAARGLGRMRPASSSAVRALAVAVGDPDALVSVTACEALRELRADRGLYAAVAIAHLESENREVRVRAWQLLRGLAPLTPAERRQLDEAAERGEGAVRRFLEHVQRSLEQDT